MPKLERDFKIVLPGEIYPVVFAAGESVDGDVAEKAAAAGCIAEPRREKKASRPPENK